MKVAIYIADKPREHYLAKCITEGAKIIGDEAITIWRRDFEHPLDDTDIACVMGVKNNSNWFIEQHLKAGKHTLYFDKGYVRQPISKNQGGWLYWRVAIDGHQPTDYFRKNKRESERWDKLGFNFQSIHTGKNILYAGSSQKFCDYYKLGDATEYAKRVIKNINKYSNSNIIYRPKPSWRHAIAIEGTEFSRPPDKIRHALLRSKTMITYGSNAVFEAMLIGMPTVVIGTAISKSIAECCIENIDNPYNPSEAERYALLCDLAYCQWQMPEFSSGKAWLDIRNTIEDF